MLKIKFTRDKNALSIHITLRQRRNGMRSPQMTSRSGRRHHSVAAGGGCYPGISAYESAVIIFNYLFINVRRVMPNTW